MKIIDQVLKTLNNIQQTDSNALQQLIERRVWCNDQLADHPTVVVESGLPQLQDSCKVGMLGILNSVVVELAIANGEPPSRVVAVYDDQTLRLLRFEACELLQFAQRR